ncbi:MAG: tetratricopeptide repeat protein [Synechococcales cyanobacterium RM1_1_8]|nr:tetratricopeptide repeat protein [Synechococcales cyanobacterium RM1_1_8]
MTGPNLEPIANALARQDYRTATELLKPLYKSHPQDPWVQLYIARIQEVSKQPQKAEQLYRKLLKVATNSKIISQARQGLQRIEAKERQQRQTAIAQAAESQTALGCLILEPLEREAKQQAVPGFARLMQLEPYSARLLLPSRGWRFYRTGPIGLLEVYVKELAEVGVPAFCVSQDELASYAVFRASRLEIEGDRCTAHALCPSEAHRPLSFPIAAVRQAIEGGLPLFELVVDTGLKQGRLGPGGQLSARKRSRTMPRFWTCTYPASGKLCDFAIGTMPIQKTPAAPSISAMPPLPSAGSGSLPSGNPSSRSSSRQRHFRPLETP